MTCVGYYRALDPKDQASKGLLIYLQPLLLILSFIPHLMNLLQFPFHSFAILKKQHLFVCLRIVYKPAETMAKIAFLGMRSAAK